MKFDEIRKKCLKKHKASSEEEEEEEEKFTRVEALGDSLGT